MMTFPKRHSKPGKHKAGHRVCKACRQSKPFAEFPPMSDYGHNNQKHLRCKACHSAAERARYAKKKATPPPDPSQAPERA